MAHWTRMAFRATIEDAPAHVLTMLELLSTDEERAIEYYKDNAELFPGEFFESRRWANFLNGNPCMYPTWGMCDKVISKDQTIWSLNVAWTQRSGSACMIEFIRWLKEWIVEEDEVIAVGICDHFDSSFRKYWIESDLPAVGLVQLNGYLDDEDPEEVFDMANNKHSMVA